MWTPDNENKLVKNKPRGVTERYTLLTEPTTWTGIVFDRNKIVTNLTADLYLHYPKLFSII